MIDLFGEMTKNRNEIIKLVEEKNQFEISFDTIDEYDALSTTANNVYNTIYQVLTN